MADNASGAEGLLPRRVGRYELLHEIASGGMASVYLGRAVGAAGFQRVVAIKVCHPHLQRDDEFVDMFLDEARLAARIHHPNVVATLDVGTEGTLHMIMEYVEGDRLLGLLRAVRKRRTHLPIDVVLRIMIETLSGLHAAHELRDSQGRPLNMVHRDVSPQNILVGFDGITKLADFGVAKAEARAVQTKTASIKGKVPYLAPEQLIGGGDIDRQVDLFAAGVVLWESLTSRRLFKGESDAETMQRILNETIAPPSTVRPEIPPELDALVMHALARSREERFRQASAMAEAMENCRVKIASTRAVSDYVRGLLADELAARTLLRQQLDEMIVAVDAVDAVDARPARRPAPARRVSDGVSEDAPSSVDSMVSPARLAPAASARRIPLAGWAAGAVLLAGAASAGYLLRAPPAASGNAAGAATSSSPARTLDAQQAAPGSLEARVDSGAPASSEAAGAHAPDASSPPGAAHRVTRPSTRAHSPERTPASRAPGTVPRPPASPATTPRGGADPGGRRFNSI